MKKNKTRHYKTFWEAMFPQLFPVSENGGGTNREQQPSIDKIWEWLGHPEIEDNV